MAIVVAPAAAFQAAASPRPPRDDGGDGGTGCDGGGVVLGPLFDVLEGLPNRRTLMCVKVTPSLP